MWRGDVILARGDIRTVALHHIIPVKGKQACEPKSFQSLRKLDRRTRIVHALEVSETSCAKKLRDRKPSLFNTFEIFDHTHDGWRTRRGVLRAVRQPSLLSSVDSYSSLSRWGTIFHESRVCRYPKRTPLDLGSGRSAGCFGLDIALAPSCW